MSQLQLSLLGTPVVQHGERTLTFSTRKALALLVYLAVEGGTHPRKTLSESFWPELDAEHGRAALRATLLELRKLFERSHESGERAHLQVERDMLGIEQGSSLILDLRLVESASKLVGRGIETLAGQAREELLAQLEQATRLVHGPFLASFTLRDSQFFDDWTRQQREYWHLRVHQLFEALSMLYEQAVRTPTAGPCWPTNCRSSLNPRPWPWPNAFVTWHLYIRRRFGHLTLHPDSHPRTCWTARSWDEQPSSAP